MARGRRAGAGALLLLAGLALPAAAHRHGNCGEDLSVRSADGWTVTRPPTFPAGPADITSYAVDARRPARQLVSNGAVLLRSTDGGCSWSIGFQLPETPTLEVPLTRATTQVRQVYARGDEWRALLTEGAGRPSTVVGGTVGVTSPADQTRPHVLVSDDAGATWRLADDGLPPNGRPLRLVESAGRAYLLMSLQPEVTSTYVAEGRLDSWRPAAAPDAVVALAAAHGPQRDLGIDATGALWSTTRTGLLRSTDRGATWAPVPGVDADAAVLDVADRTVIAYSSVAPTAQVSTDGGASWQALALPDRGVVTSATRGPTPGDLVIAMRPSPDDGRAHVFRHSVRRGEWLQVKASGPVARGLHAASGRPALFFGHSASALLAYDVASPDVGIPLVEACGVVPPLPRPPAAPPARPAALLPPNRVLAMPVGESRDVPLTLSAPARPRPLDLVFLVDTSGSMSSAICRIRTGLRTIAATISATGVDVRVGVAEFRDYASYDGGGSTSVDGFVYRRVRDVGPVDDDLVAALERLRASAGGGSIPAEAALAGLMQVATGRGQTVVPGGAGDQIPAGQGMTFRPSSARVVITVTDVHFHTDADNQAAGATTARPYPGPTFDEVAAELRRRGVRQVGLFSGSRADDEDLRAMALATGALATTPVDCDADGVPDVLPGGPLSCRLGPGGSTRSAASAVVGLVRSLADDSPLDVRVDATGTVAATIAGAVPRRLDRRRAVGLPLVVRVGCAEVGLGTARTTALLDGRTLTAQVEVTCVALPAIPGPGVPPLRPPLVAAPLPPPAAAQAPPPPSGQGHTQPNPQANAQAGFGGAAQEEHERQLALARQDVADDEPASGPATVYLMAVSLALGAAALRARRSGSTCVAAAGADSTRRV